MKTFNEFVIENKKLKFIPKGGFKQDAHIPWTILSLFVTQDPVLIKSIINPMKKEIKKLIKNKKIEPDNGKITKIDMKFAKFIKDKGAIERFDKIAMKAGANSRFDFFDLERVAADIINDIKDENI